MTRLVAIVRAIDTSFATTGKHVGWDLRAVSFSNFGPQVLPTLRVPVDDVEGLIARLGLERGPRAEVGVQFRRRPAVEREVVRLASREGQLVRRQRRHHAGIQPQRSGEVHEIRFRHANHVLRKGDHPRPVSPVFARSLGQDVLLRVVEVLGPRRVVAGLQPRVRFVHGLLRPAEVHAPLFQAVDQDEALEVLDRTGVAQRVDEVLQHGAVDFGRLGLVVACQVRAEEDVLCFDVGEGRGHALRGRLEVQRGVVDLGVGAVRLLRA